MKLGICVALPGELRCLTRKNLPLGEPFELCEGVIAIHSGIGSQRALTAGRKLLEEGAAAILSWGCATSLDEELKPGTLLLPQLIIHPDGEKSPVEEDWHQRLSEVLDPMGIIAAGAMAESPEILKNKLERAVLRERTGALGADMESGALARAAKEKGAPFLAIRAVADSTDVQIPDFISRSIDEWGRIKWSRFLIGAALKPGDWKTLANLNRCFKAAQSALKEVSGRAGPQFRAFVGA